MILLLDDQYDFGVRQKMYFYASTIVGLQIIINQRLRSISITDLFLHCNDRQELKTIYTCIFYKLFVIMTREIIEKYDFFRSIEFLNKVLNDIRKINDGTGNTLSNLFHYIKQRHLAVMSEFYNIGKMSSSHTELLMIILIAHTFDLRGMQRVEMRGLSQLLLALQLSHQRLAPH